jgi:hypothetical protein
MIGGVVVVNNDSMDLEMLARRWFMWFRLLCGWACSVVALFPIALYYFQMSTDYPADPFFLFQTLNTLSTLPFLPY